MSASLVATTDPGWVIWVMWVTFFPSKAALYKIPGLTRLTVQLEYLATYVTFCCTMILYKH